MWSNFIQELFLPNSFSMNSATHNLGGKSPPALSNKCEVVYIKEKNFDDYISQTTAIEGEINNRVT